MEEGDDLGVVVGNDVGREAAVGVAAAAAGIDHGSYAGADAAEVGVDAVAVDAFVHVGMQVDEARDHVSAGDFDDTGGVFSGQVGGDGGDFAVGNANIERAVETLSRVNDGAALDDEIIGSHGRVPSACPSMASLVSGGKGVKRGIVIIPGAAFALLG